MWMIKDSFSFSNNVTTFWFLFFSPISKKFPFLVINFKYVILSQNEIQALNDTLISQIDYKNELKEWISEIKLKNVILNFLEKNVGTVNNIIRAVDIARGKYIKTISPGDYFYSDDVLEKNKKVLEEENADIVYADVSFYSIDQIVMKKNISHNKIIYNFTFSDDVVLS